MKENRGFTLIEMAVVLGIIAILAAILTPLVVTQIDHARIVRASADTASIAKAYLLFYKDTSTWPVYFTTTAAAAGAPSRNCQFSGLAISFPSSFAGNWGAGQLNCTAANTGLIRQFLNLNTMALPTSTAAGGGPSFRGPYLDGLDANDPWGTPYIVTAKTLSSNDQSKWAFVISAGPNTNIETEAWQSKSNVLVTGGDDITALIR